jgi:hypothetical protein
MDTKEPVTILQPKAFAAMTMDPVELEKQRLEKEQQGKVMRLRGGNLKYCGLFHLKLTY